MDALGHKGKCTPPLERPLALTSRPRVICRPGCRVLPKGRASSGPSNIASWSPRSLPVEDDPSGCPLVVMDSLNSPIYNVLGQSECPCR